MRQWLSWRPELLLAHPDDDSAATRL